MSNCSTLTLCDPVTGAKVLVTSPGTADAAGFELPAGTPYAGDLAALVKCAAEGGAEAVDCNGNPLAGSVITTATGLACIDADCAPELPECPVDGQTTVDDKGITWQLIGGAWAAVAFSPASGTAVVAPGSQGFDAAAIYAWQAANGTTSTDIVCMTRVIENTDCVPWKYRADARVLAQWSAMPRNAEAQATIEFGAANTVAWRGAPQSRFDSSGRSNDNIDDKDYLHTYATGVIAPGASETFELCLQFQTFVLPAGDTNMRLDMNGGVLDICVERTCEDLVTV